MEMDRTRSQYLRGITEAGTYFTDFGKLVGGTISLPLAKGGITHGLEQLLSFVRDSVLTAQEFTELLAKYMPHQQNNAIASIESLRQNEIEDMKSLHLKI